MINTNNNTVIKPFYRELNLLRGLAILFIVAAHAWVMPVLKYTNNYSVVAELRLLDSITQTLFHGSTLLFTLISGILYALVLQHRSKLNFYSTKVKYVVIPYLCITALYTFTAWLAHEPYNLAKLAETTLHHTLHASADFHLWYIPILLVLFALSPILFKLTALYSKPMLFLGLLLPLIISRTWPYVSLSTTVYFMGAYIIGLYIGLYYSEYLAFIAKYWRLLAMAFIGLTLASIFIYQYDIKKFGFVAVNESVLFLQKICLALLLLSICQRFTERFPNWINIIASYAFGIYFIHTLILMSAIKQLKLYGLLLANPWYMATLGLLLLLFSLLASMLVVYLLKRLLGNRSRYVIGS